VAQDETDFSEGPHREEAELDETLEPAAVVPAIPRHLIQEELGRGGMGVVYRARVVADGTPVAMKMIAPAMTGKPNVLAQFLREASILRQLDHPNIVRFHEIGHAQGQLYFAMEYVPGVGADRLLEPHPGGLPIDRAVDLACQALEALAYAHGRGFVHRDIKPSNLLVMTSEGRDVVKVADFGLARLYQNSSLSGLTIMGHFAGTPRFIAPEQITNFRAAKPTVDQFSLGATLYTLLTGQPIHDFPNRFEAQLLMILEKDPVPIRLRRAETPIGLARIIHRSLARDPSARFPDAEAMRAALLPFRDLPRA
jgi:serine/threonine-protein kinase